MFQFVRGYNVSSYQGVIGANCILMGSLVNGGIRKGTLATYVTRVGVGWVESRIRSLLRYENRTLCTMVLTIIHDFRPPHAAESFHSDVAFDWCIGHRRSGCVDFGCGHGYALGALGKAIRYHVPSRIIHAGKFCGHRCLLCNYGCLSHLAEDGDQQP